MEGIVKAIQRGIAGHLTLVAAKREWDFQSELALYPVIGSILQSREFEPKCQWGLPARFGDLGAPRSIDFVARARSHNSKDWSLAIEVKRIKVRNQGTVRVKNDVEKLREFKRLYPNSHVYLLIVGRGFELRRMSLDGINYSPDERKNVIADLNETKWGSTRIKI